MQLDKDATQTRDYCVAKSATHRAARPDPSRREERLLRMTIKLIHYKMVQDLVASMSQTRLIISRWLSLRVRNSKP
jgi:hypothetical protein